MTAITKLQFSNYVQIFVAAGEIHSYQDFLTLGGPSWIVWTAGRMEPGVNIT